MQGIATNEYKKRSDFRKKFKEVNLYPKVEKFDLERNQVFNDIENVYTAPGGLGSKKRQSAAVIFFVIGGISYNEIAFLNNMVEGNALGDISLILGGTSVNTPFSLLKRYEELNERLKKEEEER